MKDSRECISLDLYATFHKLARYRSLSEASRKLHISQPALSARLAELESALGVALFNRTNHGISLTAEGQILLTHLTRGFAQIEAALIELDELTGLGSGQLRIGASDMTLRFFLLDYLELYHAKYPKVRLSVTNAPTPQTLAALHEGLIDFGVVSEPISSDDSDTLTLRPVRKLRDIFVCSKEYSHLLNRKVGPAELIGESLILLEPETSTRKAVDSFFENQLHELPKPAIELATSDLLIEFALRGIGIASVVEDFALDAINCKQLFAIDLEPAPEPRSFLLALNPRSPITPRLAAFLKLIESGE